MSSASLASFSSSKCCPRNCKPQDSKKLEIKRLQVLTIKMIEHFETGRTNRECGDACLVLSCGNLSLLQTLSVLFGPDNSEAITEKGDRLVKYLIQYYYWRELSSTATLSPKYMAPSPAQDRGRGVARMFPRGISILGRFCNLKDFRISHREASKHV